MSTAAVTAGGRGGGGGGRDGGGRGGDGGRDGGGRDGGESDGGEDEGESDGDEDQSSTTDKIKSMSFESSCSDDEMKWSTFYSSSMCSSFTASSVSTVKEPIGTCAALDDYSMLWMQVMPSVKESSSSDSQTKGFVFTSSPTSAPLPVPRILMCDPYTAANTNDANVNYQTCDIVLCPNEQLLVNSGCPWSSLTTVTGAKGGSKDSDESKGTCEGDQYVRLFWKESMTGLSVQVANADNGCGLCSSLNFMALPFGGCQTYTLRQGCASDESCGGQLAVKITSTTAMVVEDDDDGKTTDDHGHDDGNDDDIQLPFTLPSGYLKKSCVRINSTSSNIVDIAKRIEFTASQVCMYKFVQ